MNTSELISILHTRFSNNMQRHPGLAWELVLARLEAAPAHLRALQAMEDTGGEPDVVTFDGGTVDGDTHRLAFCDCCAESPAGRRSLCFDQAAWQARKDNKPAGSAIEMASKMSVALLTEDEYRQLQQLGDFDRKTSSWIATPDSVRALGGALFGDRRYGQVFVYHNGAESYYAARGFRALLRI